MIRNAVLVGLICCTMGASSADASGETIPTKEISPRPLLLDWKPLPLGGALKGAGQLWVAYKSKFIPDSGRLEDTGNRMINHSEGQGYAATLAAGASSITELSQLNKVDGRAAAFDNAGTGLDLVVAHDPTFFRTVPFGFANDRLIAAGWLSNHAAWYICMALALALLLGAFTWATLAFSRRDS